jgi:hypothetical protein
MHAPIVVSLVAILLAICWLTGSLVIGIGHASVAVAAAHSSSALLSLLAFML